MIEINIIFMISFFIIINLCQLARPKRSKGGMTNDSSPKVLYTYYNFGSLFKRKLFFLILNLYASEKLILCGEDLEFSSAKYS